MAENRFRVLAAVLLALMLLCGCGGTSVTENAKTEGDKSKETEITLFAAKSLNSSLDEIIGVFNEQNPNVKVRTNYDSSGTLMTQIAEGGAACDIFFSAGQKQVDALEEKGLTVDGSRTSLLKNQMCVVTYKGSNTKVTGLMDMDKASSLAIAGASVPIGDYTRKALINVGILDSGDDDTEITSEAISKALGNVEINECSNVGAVVASVEEQSNEVGTVYYSDLSGHEDSIEVLEVVDTDVTGDIIYPVVLVNNTEADETESAGAAQFLEFLKSDKAKEIFENYHFVVD